jgi:hypothetical protein
MCLHWDQSLVMMTVFPLFAHLRLFNSQHAIVACKMEIEFQKSALGFICCLGWVCAPYVEAWYVYLLWWSESSKLLKNG